MKNQITSGRGFFLLTLYLWF